MRRGSGADLTFATICRDFSMRTSNPKLHHPRSFGRGPFAGAGVGFRLSAFLAVLGDEIDRARLQLGKNLPDIFPDNADHDELHAADGHQADHERGIARDRLSVDKGFPENRKSEQEGAGSEQYPEQAGKTQRRHRDRGQAFDRKPDQPAGAERGDAMRAGGGLIVDADLAEADPACQALEKAIAFGELPQRRRSPRRQQTKVARIFRDFLPRAPIDQRIEAAYGKPSQQRFVVAMRLRRIDDVVALLDPVADELLDEVRGVLTILAPE